MNRSEIVAEHRSTVERVLQQQVDTAIGSWPGMSNRAKSGNADYVKVGTGDVRPVQFGLLKGMLWGVGLKAVANTEMRNVGAFDTYLALTSDDSRPDLLERRVYVHSNHLGHTAVRQLDTDTDYESALTIIRSPHLAAEAVGNLLVLSEEELETLARQIERDKESDRKLHDHLRGIDEAQRDAWFDAQDAFLN